MGQWISGRHIDALFVTEEANLYQNILGKAEPNSLKQSNSKRIEKENAVICKRITDHALAHLDQEWALDDVLPKSELTKFRRINVLHLVREFMRKGGYQITNNAGRGKPAVYLVTKSPECLHVPDKSMERERSTA